ncbi:hypothetical protein TSUD_330460 [Trifolium subterraneum]|nr:hypothetical protein TSUD_330460 [Trifolium subterraneum]
MHKLLQSVLDRVKKNDDLTAFDQDPLTRSISLERHCCGEFSMANVQANSSMEDQSQVEVASKNALYLGVYDGHGGVEASFHVLTELFNHLLRIADENGDNALTDATLRNAVAATENAFLEYVKDHVIQVPTLGKIGTCCLAGVLWNGTLHIANLGDSRAVIGSMFNRRILPVQLTRDHSCENPEIRQELEALHPGDETIVMHARGAWRVKGIIMVSRSIGDTYLKKPAFPLPDYEKVPDPYDRAVLSAVPEMLTRVIADTDKFLIFASDGLWEHLSNERAVEIVHRYPRHGIAKRLVTTALVAAATSRRTTYREMQAVAPGLGDGRRTYHDDISVIVVFFDKKPLIKKSVPSLSYRGSTEVSQQSAFAQFPLTATVAQSLAGSLKNSFNKRFKGKGKLEAPETFKGKGKLEAPETFKGKGKLEAPETFKGKGKLEAPETFKGKGKLEAPETSADRVDRDDNNQAESSKAKSRWNTLKKKFTPKKK